MPGDTPARSFRTAAAFRAWLRTHHAKAAELLVRLQRIHASDRGMTYREALDEALRYGWIDGVRRGFDADSFLIRFTPRRPRSIWSRVNVAHVERLIAAGRMTPAGMAAFDARDEARTGIYAFERKSVRLSAAYLRAFQRNPAAWRYFQKQAPWYQHTSGHWVMSAKRVATQLRRLEQLIACSADQRKLPALAGRAKSG